ncbi:serine/threonine-protein phosphatase [Streptomyces actuosus]|uniref:Serine/threonine-protein phosphatase n=1 Tax=Streptomyces actuosus TaxID=1885 RepID=A0ABS2VJ36_STRAS|nr:PP2C family protein-serine/threonine phosphatase [Streptomyces actuosus]MBN0043083.1 serine/threonine-protein phosphatase [Streptomyces actuosus]
MADEGALAQGSGHRPGGPAPAGDPAPGDPPAPPAPEGRRISRARTAVRLLPALLIAAGGVYDYYTPSTYSAVPLFIAAPLVAAPLYSRRGTVLTGLAATTVVLAVHLVLGGVFDVDAVTELVTVVTVSALAVLINTLVRRSSEQLASAREIAEAAQRAVLPEPVERIGGFQIAARYEAAQADASIGGDLYAVQDSPHGVRLIVGDVRGKGLGAVSAVAVVIGAFREAAEQETTLEAVAQRLERALAREGTRRDRVDAFEEFTTAVLAELPHGDGTLSVLNRGHPPPLLLYADGTVRALLATQPALPLGMGELGAWPDQADRAAFPGGATLLLYTDGVSETRDPQGRFYDVEERLEGRVCHDPGALLAAVAKDVRRHSGGRLTDDMALLAVRRP